MVVVVARGDLERAVLGVLWEHPDGATAREVQDALADREPATTTVLTVLTRLERKGLVVRVKEGRAHRYRAAASREEHIAGLMSDALDGAPDRGAALARFLGAIGPDGQDTLRDLLR
jgi:predicted transcriptional regulator